MQTNSVGYGQANPNALNNATIHNNDENSNQAPANKPSMQEEMENSAVKVAISMNAQIVLFAMDSENLSSNNTQAQSQIFDFLSGKEIDGGLSLKDLGYTGKPITELSVPEATQLIGDNGFFGITQTSDRVSNFVFNIAGDNLEALEKSREGIVQGFAEAQKMWGGQLPEISYQTQERTLQLIDERIAQLKG